MLRVANLVLLVSAMTSHAADIKTAWGTDLAEALRQAKKENRPVFVVFRCEH